MIKNGRYYPYGDYQGYPLVEGNCPQCGSQLYICEDGGSQGGAPYKACTNRDCNYIGYVAVEERGGITYVI
jgi:ssDNA-binding Zn-finger/Zn-ribbon topoisomerase 1